MADINHKPFDNYTLKYDEESEEVYVIAWDDSHDNDQFVARISLYDMQEIFELLSEELYRI